MHIYNNYTRSVKTGNFYLYIECLPEITNLFYQLTYANYSRWLVKNYNALIKIPHTHSKVHKDFKNG